MFLSGVMAGNFNENTRTILLPTLAVCAKDVYFFEQKHNLTKYVRELEQHRVREKLGSKNKIQYSVYEIIEGPFEGKIILAIRGTKSVRSIYHDINLIDSEQILQHYMPAIFGKMDPHDGWDIIREIIKIVRDVAEQIKPDFLTGHSLGGLLCEVVSSYTRIPGISFNCPGPVGLVTETSFLNPDSEYYKGVEFEVHLRENDPVSQINYELHINKAPIWHPGSSHHMDDMCSDIQRDMPLFIDSDSSEALTAVAKPFESVNKRKQNKSTGNRIMKWLFRDWTDLYHEMVI